MKTLLRVVAGLAMVAGAIGACASFSDAMDNIVHPERQTLGALLLVGSACFLAVLLSAGILWVLADISQQIELSRKPTPTTNEVNVPVRIAA